MTAAEAQMLPEVFTDCPAGQFIVGPSVSLTVIRKVQVLVRFAASVAFQTTVVDPLGKAVLVAPPLTSDTDPPVQLSVMEGGL